MGLKDSINNSNTFNYSSLDKNDLLCILEKIASSTLYERKNVLYTGELGMILFHLSMSGLKGHLDMWNRYGVIGKRVRTIYFDLFEKHGFYKIKINGKFAILLKGTEVIMTTDSFENINKYFKNLKR